MRAISVVGLGLVLMAGPALAQSVGEKTGVNSVLGVAPKTQDFVTEAANSDMFEIQSSALAATKLTGPDKDFADRMVADHTKTANELKPQAQAKNLTVPTTLDSTHQKWLDKLKSLNGDRFRKQYFDDQVSAHKTAVSLFKRYGNGGSDAELKTWASTTLPALQTHLKMAQDLDK